MEAHDPSPELLRAQEKLLELRRQNAAQRAAAEGRPAPGSDPVSGRDLARGGPRVASPFKKQNDGNTSHFERAVDAVAAGRSWGSGAYSVAIQRGLANRERREQQPEPAPDWEGLAEAAKARQAESEQESVVEESASYNAVKHYPELGLAARRQHLASPYRVWLVAHFLDKQANGGFRRGVIDVEGLQAAITDKDSPMHLFTPQRLGQVLDEGEQAGFWQRDNRGRLWIAGEQKLKTALGVGRLTLRPVYFSVEILTFGHGDFCGQLYTAYISGHPGGTRISQRKHREITGVPERSQSRYNKKAGVKQERNYALAERSTKARLQERAYQRGPATFEFLDANGRYGKPGTNYVAWRLPNTLRGPHPLAPKGRQKKINAATTDLVNNGALGNDRGTVNRLFYPDGASAARALGRQHTDVFWPLGPEGAPVRIWGVMSR